MRLVFDCRALDLYPLATPGFHGGTEQYVLELVRYFAGLGSEVHVLANDQKEWSQRGPHEFWWPVTQGPRQCDVVVYAHNMEATLQTSYDARHHILMTNGIDPWMGDDPDVQKKMAANISAFPVFSECHRDLLCRQRPVAPDRCFVTGLGHDPAEFKGVKRHVPDRLFYSNDPVRGLWHVLDIFDHLKKQRPDATLHVGYDFERQFRARQWHANSEAEMLWTCRERMASTPGVASQGNLDRPSYLAELKQQSLHVMPSDPPNNGSQIHGITQLESAAAGAALVLSDTEAFPEVFGEGSLILPLPGAFLPHTERRWDAQDWADNVAAVLSDPDELRTAQSQARAMAQKHTWAAVGRKWRRMIDVLDGDVDGAV